MPVLLGAGFALTAVVFAAAPALDLQAAAMFYRGGNTFAGQTPSGDALRRVLYWIPTAVLLGFAALYLARRFAASPVWGPTARGLLFLSLSFVVGPGLVVNTALKDHSHRPRPNQTLNFGGVDTFQPFYSFDGDCARNCSFVSGEGATGAWTLAPALLLPPQVRTIAVVISIAFASSVGLLRMAFGAHYLSDTLFSFLIVWALVWMLWRWMIRPPA